MTQTLENQIHDEFELNIGPQHPSTHGVLRMLLKMNAEEVISCDPVIGYLHRSIEKMCENRTFHQVVPVTDRLDYCTSMTSNYVYVLAAEKLADLTVPDRAEYIRVIMTELNRIASHLLWYGTFALELGATTPFLYSFRDREMILDIFEKICGARLLYNYIKIGGVRFDLERSVMDEILQFLDYLIPMIQEYETLLDENPIFYNRTQGIGYLSLEKAMNYGVSGPNIRACGTPIDVRKNDPFSIYADLKFDIPTEDAGDVFARYRVRMNELEQSANIIRQCIDDIPNGSHCLATNYRLKIPEGEAYAHIESARGDIGCFLVSTGGDMPWKCKFRTPSFVHIQVFRDLLPKVTIPDIMAICASFDIVLPETDR